MDTPITLAQGIKKTEEIELFEESLDLNEELIENNKEKANTTEILNVVSSVNSVGTEEREILKKNTILFAGLSFGLMFLWILIIRLNTFLKNYSMG